MSCIFCVTSTMRSEQFAGISLRPYRIDTGCAHFLVSKRDSDDFSGQAHDATECSWPSTLSTAIIARRQPSVTPAWLIGICRNQKIAVRTDRCAKRMKFFHSLKLLNCVDGICTISRNDRVHRKRLLAEHKRVGRLRKVCKTPFASPAQPDVERRVT